MVSPRASAALAACAVAALLAGCSEPGVAPRPPALQQTVSNLRDWDAAAHRLVDSMADQGFIPSAKPPPFGRTPLPAPYYVNITAQGSSFLTELRHAIERDLLDRHLPIARAPDGATVLNLSIDLVHWGSGVPYSGGVLTGVALAGAAGTAIAAGGPFTATTAAVLGATGAAAADVGFSILPDSRTELVWRADILGADHVIMDGSELLYVSADDVPLYLGTGTLPALATPGVGPLVAARPLQYAR